ncbi:MAG: DUF2298 domain-containing protein [Rhodocyclaceae bacterium]|nr:DUF2298 domain-containing protein [Rhodocyclaceae bacterium]
MNLIFLALSSLLILLNIAGLGLLLRRLTPHHALAKAVAVVGACLLLFFVEHFVGLGRLYGGWPATTAAAAFACWRQRALLRQHWRAELAFGLAFAYAFAWRFLFPNIDPSSERLTDLYFIANYLPGERLPPLDHWLPPYRFDFYYAFQHYAAALLGRLFGLDSGTTYNFAFCVTVGLIVSTAWFAVGQFCRRRAARLLVLFAFVLGSTGVAPLVHFLFAAAPAAATASGEPPPGLDITMWRSTRFVGSADADINTAFGRALFPAREATATRVPLDLPLETFSYLVFLGDYHPPLGSFLLLVIALSCIGVLEHQPADRFAQAALVGTVPLMLITNAWVFPLQAALVLGWLAYRGWRRLAPDWKALGIAGATGFALCYPALTGLAAQSLSPAIRLVPAAAHTPWRGFLALHWPLLGLLLLSQLQRATRKPALVLCLLWGGLLLLSELVYVDDIYGGQYERFNTVLKWWGWIYAGALLTLGAINGGGDSRLARYGSALVMLLVGAYSIDAARLWWWQPKPAIGQFQGHGWLTANAANRDMLNYLAAAAPGIVLDRNDKGSYSRSSAFALFAGKPALLGWADHEWLWRGSPAHVRLLADEVSAFYSGSLPDSLAWLLQHDVRYVVWQAEDNQFAPAAFSAIAQQIGSRYGWQPFQVTGDYRIGLWIRRPPN